MIKKATSLILLFLCYIDVSISKEMQTSGGLGQKNEQISEAIDELANDLDFYLVEKRQTYKENETTLEIEARASHSEGSDARLNPQIDLNLHLPQFQEKWRVFFTNYDKFNDERQSFRQPGNNTSANEPKFVGFNFARDLDDFEVEFRPQLQLAETLQTRYVAIVNNVVKLQRRRVLTVEFQLYGDSEKGVGEILSLSWRAPIAKQWSVQVGAREEYFDSENTLITSKTLGATYRISKEKAVNLGSVVTASSRPSYHLDTYSFQLGWDQVLLHDEYNYSITPFVEFAKVNRFKGAVGVTASFHIIF